MTWFWAFVCAAYCVCMSNIDVASLYFLHYIIHFLLLHIYFSTVQLGGGTRIPENSNSTHSNFQAQPCSFETL